MEFRAEAESAARLAAKARLVLNLIKGRRVEEARNHAGIYRSAWRRRWEAVTVGNRQRIS